MIFESSLLVTLRRSSRFLSLQNRRRLIRSVQSSVCEGLKYEPSTGKLKLRGWKVSKTWEFLRQGELTTFIPLKGKRLTSTSQKTKSAMMVVSNSQKKKRWNWCRDSRDVLVEQVTQVVNKRNEEVWGIRLCLLHRSCLLIGPRFTVSRITVLPISDSDRQAPRTHQLTQATETSRTLIKRITKGKSDFRSNYTREASHRQIRQVWSLEGAISPCSQSVYSKLVEGKFEN